MIFHPESGNDKYEAENDVIGIIVATAYGAVFQQQGDIGDEAARFLVGYREAAGRAGFGVHMLPIILTGSWSFPGTGRLGEEKRCLVGLQDGSGNDGVYHSVLRFFPTLLDGDDEVVISFIAVDSFQHCSVEDALDTGRLAACFDLAAWGVDTLPAQLSNGLHDLTKGEAKVLSLGVWVNILITWLCRTNIVSQHVLQKMRLAICGIVIEKLAILRPGQNDSNIDAYIKAQPGIMVRLADMLSCYPEEQLAHLPTNPDGLCRAIVEHSLRFFQDKKSV